MRAVLTAVIAAIEACAVALAGIVLVGVPAVLLWWLAFGFGAEPQAVVSTVSGVWLLAHFVPIGIEIGPEAALGLGLPAQSIAFGISLAPLGITLLTVLLAFRAGWRFASRGGSGISGVIGGVLGFAGAAYAVLALGDPPIAWPVWAAVLVPAACFAAASLVGFVWCSALEGFPWWQAAMRRLRGSGSAGETLAEWGLDTLKLAVAALAAVIGLGAVGFAVSIVAGYVEIVTISQSLQLDPLGIILMFALSIVLLPIACIWSVAWLSGAGFAIGTGTWASSFETTLGPVPALPMLGAVPESWGWAAPVAPLLVVVLGVAVGALAGGSSWLRRAGWAHAIGVALIAAVLAGLAMSGLSALASGSIGPDRLSRVGVDAWLAGALVAGELGLGMVLGVIARRVDRDRHGERALPWRREDAPTGLAVPEGRDSHPPTLTGGADSDQETVPLHPLPPAPQPQPQPAEAETVPLDPLPAPPPRASAPATPEAEAPRSAPVRPVPTSTPAPPPVSGPVLDADADSETIARAYAWDDAVQVDPPREPETKRLKWRRPRRDG